MRNRPGQSGSPPDRQFAGDAALGAAFDATAAKAPLRLGDLPLHARTPARPARRLLWAVAERVVFVGDAVAAPVGGDLVGAPCPRRAPCRGRPWGRGQGCCRGRRWVRGEPAARRGGRAGRFADRPRRLRGGWRDRAAWAQPRGWLRAARCARRCSAAGRGWPSWRPRPPTGSLDSICAGRTSRTRGCRSTRPTTGSLTNPRTR